MTLSYTHGDSGTYGAIAGVYYGTPAAAVTTSARGQNQHCVTPFVVQSTTTYDRIRAEVTATAAASTVRLGIYGSTDGKPGSLIVDAGTIDGTSATTQEITISETLTPGLYWLSAVNQGGNPTLRCISTPSFWLAPNDGTMSDITKLGFLVGGVSGALPATYNYASSTMSSTLPRVLLRAA